ncbi:MAG: hypothetical protein F4218_10955 [Synechococcus sp. SB0677_bin_5]|nr:hypothetical protein [Synechococcus sp. SB0677_bin_5]
MDALQQRFSAPPTPPGLGLTLAGEELSVAVSLAENRPVLAKALGFETVSPSQLVQDSSFHFSPIPADAPRFALWGQGVLSSFSGQQDSVAQEGEVAPPWWGRVWSSQRWRAGTALSHSWGNGSYGGEGDNSGAVDSSSTLTGIFPYGSLRPHPTVGHLGRGGYGWGQLSLQPDGAATEYEANTNLRLAAIGLDGLLREGGDAGISLITTTDVLVVHTASEEVDGVQSSEGSPASALAWRLPGPAPWRMGRPSSPPWNWA